MSSSNFRQALRLMVLEQLVCPRCDAANSDRQPRHLELDEHNEASCNVCGFAWKPKELEP